VVFSVGIPVRRGTRGRGVVGVMTSYGINNYSDPRLHLGKVILEGHFRNAVRTVQHHLFYLVVRRCDIFSTHAR
jgi:hypothetical protein